MEQINSEKGNVMKQIAAMIVRYRYVIFLLFGAAAVYCAFSVGRVRINEDITAFLPAETETRRGLSIMEDEFITYATANVMVSNITFDMGSRIADEIAALDHVTDVSYDDTTAHFTHSAALLSVSFDGTGSDPGVIGAMKKIRELVGPYDTYISSAIGSNYAAQLASEMLGVILLAALVIVAVLLFTSRSYFEVVIFFIVFVFAALLNMGTNFWLGEISSITNSIAVILQLALAIDYAIIFSHRYQDEALVYDRARDALVEALSKAIIEISSSSLTTISGLVALTLMQFRLGYDLGIVLSKGILCSLLTVFLLMPGLIMLFPRALARTTHKNLIPDIRPWGRFLMKYRFIFVAVFLLVIPAAIICSNRVTYAFADSSIDELVYSESRHAMHKISGTFSDDTVIAVLVPAGDFDKEREILSEAEDLDHIKSVMGLSNIEIERGRVLTDPYSPRMFAELVDIDAEQAVLLFQAYGVEHEEYQAIFGTPAEYRVPLIDMLLYLFEKIDQGVVTLTDSQHELIDPLRGSLERGDKQLRGEHWDRLVLTSDVPVEGAESVALVERVRAVAEAQYGEGQVLVVGDITSARDLADSFNSDSLKISILTIVFVFLILLFTFRTFIGSVILVFVIQGSIWINFSFPYLTDTRCSFVTNMIVSAIQMGATIDYAIVLMNRFQTRKRDLPVREAMVEAVNEAFATVLTSGSIMTIAGLLISFRISDVYVGHIGLAVGRGALISVILVLTVLPQLLVLFNRLIDRTTFAVHLNELKGGTDP